MTVQEVVEIIKESHLWQSLPQNEKRETIMYALQMNNVPIDEEEKQSIVDDIFSTSEDLQDLRESSSEGED